MVAPESVGFLFAECDDVGNSGAELIVHVIHCMFSYVFSVANIQLLWKYSVFLNSIQQISCQNVRDNVKQTKKRLHVLDKREGVLSKR